jgi:hypothetical protein
MIHALIGQVFAPIPTPPPPVAPIVLSTPAVAPTGPPSSVRPANYPPGLAGGESAPAAGGVPTTSPAPAAMPSVVLSAPRTYSTALECVVTLTPPSGLPVTFSPGPADSSGSCAAYSTGWPAQDGVTVVPTSETVTGP